jgi:hypothetical protein
MNPRDRERRFRLIGEIGCLPCRKRGWYTVPERHHQNFGAHAGGKRLGDEATVGLCRWHHQGKPPEGMTRLQAERIMGPSLALQPIRFRETFGSDDELLAEQNELIESAERNIVGRIA